MKNDELAGVQQHLCQETHINDASTVSAANNNTSMDKPIDLKHINLMPKVNAAIEYGRMGLRVFPVKPNCKSPQIKGWKELATSEVKEIIKLWIKFPEANIGILCGESGGVFVIDIDVKNGAKGMESLALFESYISLATHKVTTPSGGLHYYFKPVKGFKNKVDVLPGIDTRSDGGYIVAPPSIIDEGEYKWN